MLNFYLISIFPDSFKSYLNSSMLWRAQKEKKIKVHFYNPRDYSLDKHKKVDGRSYGGGPGMVMQVAPILRAIAAAKKKIKKGETKIIITSPAGKNFNNKIAENWSRKFDHLIVICGHYEGIDARVKKILKAEEISIGPYVLTGGELPALVIVDAIARRIPGVLGNDVSLEEKRVSSSEVYTRPEVYKLNGKSYKVPKILLSGHHAKIGEWKKAKNRTKK